MYQVIARKYRPQSFRDVVNQEHVKTTLQNAIERGRIAHGYIFSGQRGTGKTTLARILARCLNCIQGPIVEPCGACASCLEIATGSSVDVIEIDAASNRGINEMRELRENVRYQPARDRYKVFIIDEAHQITSEAFNALLKTIEEPPPWVVFLLCTTEAHKIPATIASRCQHFSFRSVDFDEVVARMEWICRLEGIEAGPEALAVLAQVGEGSIRDSLSALDQAIACCGLRLEAADVRALLGAFSLESLDQVTDALQQSDSARMLQVVDDLERNGHNLQHFSRELGRYFRNLLVAKIAGKDTRLIAASPDERSRLTEIAARFSEEDLTRYLQLTLDLFQDLQSSLQPRLHLEIGLVKLVHAGRLVAIEEVLGGVAPSSAPDSSGGKAEPSSKRGGSVTAPPQPSAQSVEPDWKQKLHSVLMEMGMTFTADAVEHSKIVRVGGELQFTTPKDLSLGINAEDIDKAVVRIFGKPLRIKLTLGEVRPEITGPVAAKLGEDDLSQRALSNSEVQRFREIFGGEVRAVRNLKE